MEAYAMIAPQQVEGALIECLSQFSPFPTQKSILHIEELYIKKETVGVNEVITGEWLFP